MRILPGDLDHPAVIGLLEYHLEANIAVTPVGSVHALDLDALKVPSIRFFAGWDGDTLLTIGAWKRHDAALGEIKSMRTVESERGKGLGAQMLDHIIADAQDQGVERLSLETGAFDYFAPARKLYEKRGFTYCEPFADYVPDPNSAFMTKVL
ncbi:MAG: GNAT family N-acetyltransferase [Devosiaceae bacterium]|nr:GNAT family N-acetyltransferase [Devosiaceae bacterium MH13]